MENRCNCGCDCHVSGNMEGKNQCFAEKKNGLEFCDYCEETCKAQKLKMNEYIAELRAELSKETIEEGKEEVEEGEEDVSDEEAKELAENRWEDEEDYQLTESRAIRQDFLLRNND